MLSFGDMCGLNSCIHVLLMTSPDRLLQLASLRRAHEASGRFFLYELILIGILKAVQLRAVPGG